MGGNHLSLKGVWGRLQFYIKENVILTLILPYRDPYTV